MYSSVSNPLIFSCFPVGLQLDVCGIFQLLSEHLFQRFCLFLDLFRADLEEGLVGMNQERRQSGFRIDERAGLISVVQPDLRVFDFERDLLNLAGMFESFLDNVVSSRSESEAGKSWQRRQSFYS